MVWEKHDRVRRSDVKRLVKKLANAMPSDYNGTDEYGKVPFFNAAKQKDLDLLRSDNGRLQAQITDLQRTIRKLTSLIPDIFTVTKFKSSERPPEQLFKVVNKLTGSEAYGATEDEARRLVV